MGTTNKEIVIRFFNEMDNHNLSVIDELLTENFQEFSTHGKVSGRQNYKLYSQDTLNSFPDLSLKVIDLFSENDKVAVRGILSGTNTGNFMKMPPTNKKVNVSFIAVLRIENGLIAERWLNGDDITFMQQLGLMPEQH